MRTPYALLALAAGTMLAVQPTVASPASGTPELAPEVAEGVALPILDSPAERRDYVAAAAAIDQVPDLQVANVWADDHSSTVYVGVTSPTAQVSIEDALGDAGVANYELVPVENSQSDLDSIVETIYQQPGMDAITSAAHDYANNRVIVTADLPSDALRAQLFALYGNTVALEQQPLEINSEASGGLPLSTATMDDPALKAIAAARRDEDYSPFYAGGRFGARNSGGVASKPHCTFGFSWVMPSGDPRMLTAGHCYEQTTIANGGLIGATTDYGGSDGDYTYAAGKAILSTADGGSVGTDGDLALINTNKDWNGNTIGRSGAPRIWNGGWQTTSSIPVIAVDQWSANDDLVCYSGMHRGTQCGAGVDSDGDGGYKVVDKDDSYKDSGTGFVYTHVAQANKGWGKCSKPGESGAPIYRSGANGATAVGILSGGGGGGSDYYIGQVEGAAPGVDCRIWFTEIGQAYEAFNGDVELN